MFYLVLCCSGLFYPVPCCPGLFYHVLFCAVLAYSIMFCSVLFKPILSCSVLCCPGLFYHVLCCTAILYVMQPCLLLFSLSAVHVEGLLCFDFTSLHFSSPSIYSNILWPYVCALYHDRTFRLSRCWCNQKSDGSWHIWFRGCRDDSWSGWGGDWQNPVWRLRKVSIKISISYHRPVYCTAL